MKVTVGNANSSIQFNDIYFLIYLFVSMQTPHPTQPTFCFGVGEAVSCESEEAGLEILDAKLLPSLGSLDHDTEKGKW